MAMRWSRWVATVPPPRTWPAAPAHDQVVALDARGRRRPRRGPSATAARRSLSLTRSSCRPAHARLALREGGGDGEHRIFVDHRRRARRRARRRPCSARCAHAQVGDVLAALDAAVRARRCRRPSRAASSAGRCAAGSSSCPRRRRPSPARSAPPPCGKAAEEGSAGTTTGAALQLGPALERDAAAVLRPPASR